MAGINEDRERHVVPLWRTFETTNLRGELASLAPADAGRFSDQLLKELVADWVESPTPPVAADLVSVALTLGRFDVAVDAANLLLTSGTAAAKSAAALYLDRGQPRKASVVESDAGAFKTGATTLEERLHVEVRSVRANLIEYPRNPILWSNLALLYTSLGVQEKAERAIRGALTLAPDNRFVLRAASRFYLHNGRQDLAHRILTGAASVRHDPWILSAEIATAAAIGRTSGNIRLGRRFLELERQGPFHLSELASAIGTLESRAGNLRSARPLISYSLQQPAENSIAQAAWIERNIGGLRIQLAPTSLACYEANAWIAHNKSQWPSVLAEARRWQAEQPFSSRPAILGSYIASRTLEDHESSIAFAKQGLLSNPDDFILRNNLVFSLALSNDIDGARWHLRQLEHGQLTRAQQITYTATRGLVAFRSGDPARGRTLYRTAIEAARANKDKREIIGTIYLAFEELRSRSPQADSVRASALELAKALSEPADLALAERLRRTQPGQ